VEPIHTAVLDAARACASTDWSFRVADVITALSHLNPATVRTHVASRCCSNAPANHDTRYRYFRALRRGVYRLEPTFRQRRARGVQSSQERILASVDSGVDATLIAESLAMTPTERLESMHGAAKAMAAMRRR
jgi:hypothetical protein